MILYHGSYKEIKEIDLTKAEIGKDFGKGFYTTSTHEHANIWAKRQGERYNNKGVVSAFEFDYDRAFLSSGYKTLKFDGYTEEWLDFVRANRTNHTNTNNHDYDIVEGPIADDRVNENMPEYEKGLISAEEFLKMLKYDGSHQICFCTTKSLDTIERINLEAHIKREKIASSVICYLEIKDKIPEKEAQDLYYESETFKKVSDESTLLYMKSWQEIYEMVKKEIEKPQLKQKDDYNGLSF